MKNLFTLLLIIVFIQACNDTKTAPTKAKKQQTVASETASEVIAPAAPIKVNTGKVYLEGLYATSSKTKNPPHFAFDGDEKTSWQTKLGTGRDEGLMLYFAKPIFVDKLELEFLYEEGLAEPMTILAYVNGIPNRFSNFDRGSLKIDTLVSALFIRILDTNPDVEQSSINDSRSLYTYSEKISVALEELTLFNKEEEPYQLIAPAQKNGTIQVSSTLDPASAYHVGQLFDARKEFAWVEGNENNGVGERIFFEFDEVQTIDALKIWNGYQRSDSHYQSNSSIKEFRFGVKGSTLNDYNLNKSKKGERVELNEKLTGKTFELVVKSVYDGRTYKDLAISELLFFNDQIPFVLKSNMANEFEQQLLAKTESTIIENLLNKRINNTTEEDDVYGDYSIVLRSNGTFVMYTVEYSPPDDSQEIIADGNWELISADANSARIKVFGNYRNITSELAYYRGFESGEASRIFKDFLMIADNKIQGEKYLDEIHFK